MPGRPTCTLTLNMLSAAAVISPTQRLIVTYQTQLDANTQKGVALTNVAGATQWYNGAEQQHQPPDLHLHADQRHARSAGLSGRAHRDGGAARGRRSPSR